jgi:hypothetical protein
MAVRSEIVAAYSVRVPLFEPLAFADPAIRQQWIEDKGRPAR